MVDLPTPEGPQMTRGRMGLTGAMVDREAKIPAERDVDIGFKVSFVEKSRPMTLTAAFEPITFISLFPGKPLSKHRSLQWQMILGVTEALSSSYSRGGHRWILARREVELKMGSDSRD